MTMSFENGSFLKSYLAQLSDKQLTSLGAWQRERLVSHDSSSPHPLYMSKHIQREKERRGMCLQQLTRR